jgi:hypothetical protein
MHIKYGHPHDPDLTPETLIDSYSAHQFESPLRSTVPLLAFWLNPEERRRFCEKFNLLSPDEATGTFEYKVRPPRGRGTASHTDLMLEWPSNSHCVAIEAKYTEPPYQQVANWLRTGNINNRRDVLQGWLELIHRVTGILLTIEQVQEVEYQLIHRVASACSVDSKVRHVVYQVFGLTEDMEQCNHYIEQLRTLRQMLNSPLTPKLTLLAIPIRPENRYTNLMNRWHVGHRHLNEEVIEGILGNDLMTFEEPLVVWQE